MMEILRSSMERSSSRSNVGGRGMAFRLGGRFGVTLHSLTELVPLSAVSDK